ncbi:unnamed protein product [Clonostachys rosea f. rosea IK726]|uniref:Branched-chain-amino-acid aminotransferase n=2 Tax=Bionectria ochroleuca TaxID=29856 RepID=A0A0B7K1S4_BIOOC|nr:unnamed protein product [Clonostachys rosea f. rosea IK726]
MLIATKPRSSGNYLYIRPTMIGTQAQLGVQEPKTAQMYIIITFMPVMDTPAGGMRLHTSPEDMVHAWVGGFGYAKLGANYGPSLKCIEAGASNFFVLWKRMDGRKELIVAPLDDKLIMDAVTRRSCLELARERLGDNIVITERKYSIDGVIEADSEGRILEAFAAGTAFFICAVSQIHHHGKDINTPMGPENELGEVTKKIKSRLFDVMYSKTQLEWGVVIPEKE